MKSIIRVENLGKRYTLGEKQAYYSLRDSISNVFKPKTAPVDNFWALKDVNFEVKQGESIGIIGRNGAGKSTLLKILSRITPPTTGKVTLEGRVASLLEVGTGFNPELTGRENIYLNGAILGMKRSEIKRKFDEIVFFSEIEKFLDTPVKHYSSGMYMRLAFSVAAHLESEILIVDEVLAVGDSQFQNKCLGKMGEVTSKEGRTVLFVSHNMGAIRQLCTKAIYISHGELLSYGNTKDIISHYINDSSNQPSNIISNIKSRPGNGAVRVENFSVTNSRGELAISSFDKLRIKVKLRVNSKVKQIQLKIPIIDLSSEVLFRIDTDQLKINSQKSLTITLETAELCITPSKCFINIGVFADGDLSDYIKDIYSFDILKKIKNNVKYYDRDMSLLMLPYRLLEMYDNKR